MLSLEQNRIEVFVFLVRCCAVLNFIFWFFRWPDTFVGENMGVWERLSLNSVNCLQKLLYSYAKFVNFLGASLINHCFSTFLQSLPHCALNSIKYVMFSHGLISCVGNTSCYNHNLSSDIVWPSSLPDRLTSLIWEPRIERRLGTVRSRVTCLYTQFTWMDWESCTGTSLGFLMELL